MPWGWRLPCFGFVLALNNEPTVADKGLKGRKMFGAAACFACHHFGNEGGMTGPDLTTAGARYNARDFLDQVINPSKEINEQFVPVVLTKTDGEKITGIIVNLNGDTVQVNTDLGAYVLSGGDAKHAMFR